MNDTVQSTAGSGFLGGAASGLLLSIGTTAFEFTKVIHIVHPLVRVNQGEGADDRSRDFSILQIKLRMFS